MDTPMYDPWRDLEARYPEYSVDDSRMFDDSTEAVWRAGTLYLNAALSRAIHRSTLAREIAALDQYGDPSIVPEELAASRLIDDVDLSAALTAAILAGLSSGAALLTVDTHALVARITALTPEERSTIAADVQIQLAARAVSAA